MTLLTLAHALVWSGVVLSGGLLLYRRRRGAWSLEDEDIPRAGWGQKAVLAAALTVALAGLALFVAGWRDRGLG